MTAHQLHEDITLETLLDLEEYNQSLQSEDQVVHILCKDNLEGDDWLELRGIKKRTAKKITMQVRNREKHCFKIYLKPGTLLDVQINKRIRNIDKPISPPQTAENLIDIPTPYWANTTFDALCNEFDRAVLSDTPTMTEEELTDLSVSIFSNNLQWHGYPDLNVEDTYLLDSDRIYGSRLQKLTLNSLSKVQEAALRDCITKSDVDSLLHFIVQMNHDSHFLCRGVEINTYFIRQEMKGPPTYWKSVSRKELVRWLRYLVESFSMLYLRHLERYGDNFVKHSGRIASLETVSPAQILHARVLGAIGNNMEEITSLAMGQSPSLNPWGVPDSLSLQNGVCQVHHFDEDQTRLCGRQLFDFTPYSILDQETTVVQMVPVSGHAWFHPSPEESEHWNRLIARKPSIVKFVTKAIASCLFRATTNIIETDGSYKRTFILQNCTEKSAAEIQNLLETLYGSYMLSHHTEKVSEKVAATDQANYRFVLTNLFTYYKDKKAVKRFDVARNLLSSIPHIILGGPAAHTDINFSGHEPVYIVDLEPKVDSQVLTSDRKTSFHFVYVHEIMMQQWKEHQEYSHLSKILPTMMPKSVRKRSQEVTDLATWSIEYITRFVIQNERNVSSPKVGEESVEKNATTGISDQQLTDGFMQYILARNQKRKPGHQFTEDILRSYRYFAVDHLSRMTQQEDFWYNVHLHKQDENFPVYYYPFGSKENRGFEDLYVFHTTSQSTPRRKENDPPLPRDCTRTEFFNWMKKVDKLQSWITGSCYIHFLRTSDLLWWLWVFFTIVVNIININELMLQNRRSIFFVFREFEFISLQLLLHYI